LLAQDRARQERVEQLDASASKKPKGPAEAPQPPQPKVQPKMKLASKLQYDATHTAWRGKLELCNDGSFRRVIHFMIRAMDDI
jgi:hypothetical protein